MAPLIAAATRDGHAFLTAQQTAWEATTTQEGAGRFRRRGAAKVRDDANRTRVTIEKEMRERWGTTPHTPDGLGPWAETVAQKHANPLPAVVDAERRGEEAHTAVNQTARRHLTEMGRLRARVYGADGQYPQGGPEGRVPLWHAHANATALRENLATIETLPAEQAAQLIRQQHAEAEARRTATERALTQRREQLDTPDRTPSHRAGPGPERGIGF